MKLYQFTPEQLAALFLTVESMHSFLHSPRSAEELKEFQRNEYKNVHTLLYDIVVPKIDSSVIDALSDEDSERGENRHSVGFLTELLSKSSQS